MALVVMLVTSGISSACSYTTSIPQEDSMERKRRGNYTVTVYPQSSLENLSPPSRTRPYPPEIKPGTNLVIHIVRSFSAPIFSTAGGSTQTLWLEASQQKLEIGENEITITEWSKLGYESDGQRYAFWSTEGDIYGVLKIRMQNKRKFFGGQKTSFHGTARFRFLNDGGYNVDWIF